MRQFKIVETAPNISAVTSGVFLNLAERFATGFIETE